MISTLSSLPKMKSEKKENLNALVLLDVAEKCLNTGKRKLGKINIK